MLCQRVRESLSMDRATPLFPTSSLKWSGTWAIICFFRAITWPIRKAYSSFWVCNAFANSRGACMGWTPCFSLCRSFLWRRSAWVRDINSLLTRWSTSLQHRNSFRMSLCLRNWKWVREPEGTTHCNLPTPLERADWCPARSQAFRRWIGERIYSHEAMVTLQCNV